MKGEDSDLMVRLISDKAFINWVIRPDKDSTLYWEKWQESRPDHSETLAKAREFVLRIKFKEYRLSESENSTLLSNIISSEEPGRFKKLTGTKPTHSNDYPYIRTLLRYAAMVSIFILAAYAYRYMQDDVKRLTPQPEPVTFSKTNPKIHKSRFSLPDGSIVSLNAESSIDYIFDFQKGEREVFLKGEAFFEVKKNEKYPFIVHAGGIATRALGTSFNIRYFENEPSVNIALLSGRVGMELEKGKLDAENTFLLPGEKLIYQRENGINEKVKFEPMDDLAWKDGVLVFKNADFDEFVRRLEHWFGVDFSIEGTPKEVWNVNGRFTTETLREILVGVNFTYDIEYSIKGEDVILKLK
ncbi:MAG: FecR domain-containing protein [Cyclobacteriaceae bacterium]|nr:FecR domain-containing protein [Cyclobacteriaceae bacterium]